MAMLSADTITAEYLDVMCSIWKAEFSLFSFLVKRRLLPLASDTFLVTAWRFLHVYFLGW